MIVNQINDLESEYQQLSDEELSSLKEKFKTLKKDSGFDLLAHTFAATSPKARASGM